MVMTDSLTQFIIQELLDEYDEVTLGEDDDILTTGLIDSLGIMRLVTYIEETFEKKIPYGDITIENFRTIKTIVSYLQKQH